MENGSRAIADLAPCRSAIFRVAFSAKERRPIMSALAGSSSSSSAARLSAGRRTARLRAGRRHAGLLPGRLPRRQRSRLQPGAGRARAGHHAGTDLRAASSARSSSWRWPVSRRPHRPIPTARGRRSAPARSPRHRLHARRGRVQWIIGFVAGAIVGQLQLYRQSADARLARVRPILKQPPFTDVQAEPTSDGKRRPDRHGRVRAGSQGPGGADAVPVRRRGCAVHDRRRRCRQEMTIPTRPHLQRN